MIIPEHLKSCKHFTESTNFLCQQLKRYSGSDSITKIKEDDINPVPKVNLFILILFPAISLVAEEILERDYLHPTYS